MPTSHKEIARELIEEFGSGNVRALYELCDPDILVHGLDVPAAGIDGFKAVLAAYRSAFPDSRVQVESTIEEGDTVACRFAYFGTHKGELMGVPPTGKEVSFTGIFMLRLEGPTAASAQPAGKAAQPKVVEIWAEHDLLSVMVHLGAAEKRRPAA